LKKANVKEPIQKSRLHLIVGGFFNVFNTNVS